MLSFIINFTLFPLAIYGKGNNFDIEENCASFLEKKDLFANEILAIWGFGYIFAKTEEKVAINRDEIERFINEINIFCGKDPSANIISLINIYAQNYVVPLGTPEQGQRMLENFVASGKSLAEFIKSLEPKEEDIRAVYRDPLATKLIALYKEIYASLSGLRMNPEHNAVETYFTTTKELVNNPEIAKYFPAGYKKVIPYMIGDHPIASFKFVKLGEDKGFNFSGLIFVNGRWTLMPKPWRGLE